MWHLLSDDRCTFVPHVLCCVCILNDMRGDMREIVAEAVAYHFSVSRCEILVFPRDNLWLNLRREQVLQSTSFFFFQSRSVYVRVRQSVILRLSPVFCGFKKKKKSRSIHGARERIYTYFSPIWKQTYIYTYTLFVWPVFNVSIQEASECCVAHRLRLMSW